MLVKISEVKKILSQKNKNLLYDPSKSYADMQFMSEYINSNNIENYDIDFVNLYGDREFYLSDNILEENYSTYFSTLIYAYLSANKYMYTKLFSTTNFEYNPIWNVEGSETRTTTRTPNITENYQNGKQKGTTTDSMTPFTDSNYTDTNKSIVENDAYNDSHTTTGTETTIDKFERGMNLGMMSTQNLIEQERAIALYSFYENMFKNIVDRFCLGVY